MPHPSHKLSHNPSESQDILITPPGPYESSERLQTLLRETESLEKYPAGQRARQQGRTYLTWAQEREGKAARKA